MRWILQRVRKLVYKMGFRPKPGSIFFSPTLGWIYAVMDADPFKSAEEGWRKAMKTLDE